MKCAPDSRGAATKAFVDAAKPGEVVLLENTRFHASETKNGADYAKDVGLMMFLMRYSSMMLSLLFLVCGVFVRGFILLNPFYPSCLLKNLPTTTKSINKSIKQIKMSKNLARLFC